MDENNPHIRQQASVCSDTNSEEPAKVESISLPLDKRICIVGDLVKDPATCAAAQTFGVPIITSETGEEYARDHTCCTIFVLEKFEGAIFDLLCKSKHPLLGPPALQQLSAKNERLPNNTRPLFNLSMTGVVVCFTGFRNKEDLTRLVPLIHHMGGSIRKEMSVKVTHLIANVFGGDKYQYAAAFRVPVMHLNWVVASWEHRHDIPFNATTDTFMAEFKLKPFHGARVCFFGFAQDEERHMAEILEQNGGTVTHRDDPACTHVVVEQTNIYTLEADSVSHSPKSPTNSANASPVSHNQATPSLFPPISSAPCTPLATRAKCYKVLETLHEKSNDDCLDELNETIFDTTVCSNVTNFSVTNRKRKFVSPIQSGLNNKRKRELCHSEKKGKMSNFFKTPIEYFSNRRRTIGGSTLNQSINESILSSSGVFDVETVENLHRLNSTEVTPSTSSSSRKTKKNLFKRTFSTSKLKKTFSRRSDLNCSKLSFGDMSECDGRNEDSDCASSSNLTLPPLPYREPPQPHREPPQPYREPNQSCREPNQTYREPPQSYREPPPPFCEQQLCSFRKKDAGHPITHTVVVDESSVSEKPEGLLKAYVVKAEWFWTSVQKEYGLEEKEYLFDDYIDQVLSPSRRDSHQATPSSASRRKRKRLHETLSSLAHQQSPGSFLDCTASPDKLVLDGPEGATVADTPRKGLTARQQVFLELVQTESNYVNILHTIMTMFKKHLEEMPDEEALLNNTELKIIFGNLPPIYETHVRMLEELRRMSASWSEDKSIGNIILKYSTDLLKAYPPFVNFFEEMKDMLIQCDANKPRFHAFLKACQTRPECGRQGLQDLLIRPVQRLPSISLLLNDILKHTPKSNPDHSALDQALAAVREVMTHINEDKRKTEGQRVMFDIFNDIDNCPPDLVSSHRSFIAKSEVIQLSSSEGLSNKGNPLVLFLFSDQLEVCKKRSKAFNTLKSPNTVNGLPQKSSSKPYKHVKLMSLSTIKRVIDIKETEDCQKVFSLVHRNNDEVKEGLFSFAMTDEEADKCAFLKTLCKQMATNACTADADKFLAYLEPHQLDINTNDLNNGTLSKAFKFATRTRLKVGRAFSFNKTPSKLKRAVSSMMSPFGSSTNLTPASQLAQMRLASYNNINELGNLGHASESPPMAPMSVQPTRKLKSSSLGVSALKRL